MRPLVVLAAVAVAAALFVALRPDDEQAAPTTTAVRTPPRTTPARAETVPQTARATTERLTATRISARVVVRDGRVQGGIRRFPVARGSLVTLVVTADVTDHVHLHGYDVMRDVAPGAPARLTFRASIAGRFEVELEDAGRQIAEVQVRP